MPTDYQPVTQSAAAAASSSRELTTSIRAMAEDAARAGDAGRGFAADADEVRIWPGRPRRRPRP